jgi:hypothetical protein
VAEKLGMPYSTVRYHAWTEDWGVQSRGGQQDPSYQAAKAKQIRRKLEKEEKRLEQELAPVKAEDLELLAQRSLAADSARAKVAVSRRVTEILSRLADPTIPVRSAAHALGSLAPILRLLYGWGGEPDLQRMKRSVTSYAKDDMPEDFTPTAAVNLGLIATSPEQLAAMAEAKFNRDNQDDASVSECNEQGMGPFVVAPEQPPAAAHGRPIPKKEAPKPPLECRSSRERRGGKFDEPKSRQVELSPRAYLGLVHEAWQSGMNLSDLVNGIVWGHLEERSQRASRARTAEEEREMRRVQIS